MYGNKIVKNYVSSDNSVPNEKINHRKDSVNKREFLHVSKGAFLGAWEFTEELKQHSHGAVVQSKKVKLYKLALKVN